MRTKERKIKISKLKEISEEVLSSIDDNDILFEDISKIYNLSCSLSEKITNEDYLDKRSSEKLLPNKKNFEFKLGTNLLNLIGIMLVLISFCICGAYVYSNFLNNTSKGIALFTLFTICLILGEKVLKNRNKIISRIVSSIGIAGLYIALIVNYILLGNINNIIAVIIAFLITTITFYYSGKCESHLIRMISLISGFGSAFLILIQGGYIAHSMVVLANDYESSIIVSVLLILVSLCNVLMPVKNSKYFKITFEIYSTFIILFFIILIGTYMDSEVYHLLILIELFITNIMFVKSKNKDNRLQTIIMIMNSIIFTVLIFSNMSVIQEILLSGIILLFMVLFAIITRKNKYGSFYYAKAMIIFATIILFIDSLTAFSNTLFIVILTISFMFIGIIMDSVKSNVPIRVIKYFSLVYTAIYFISINHSHYLMGCFMYTASFIIIQHILTDNVNAKYYKFEMKFMKYFILFALAYTTLYVVDNYSNAKFISSGISYYKELPYICVAVVSQIYYIINKKVNELTINERDDGKFILVIMISNILLGYIGDIVFVITSIFITFDIICLLEKNVARFYKVNKKFACWLFISFILLRLDDIKSFNIDGVIIGFLLIIVALISVYIGFIKEKVIVRQYGLCLAFFVSIKLLFNDLHYLGFGVKTLAFFIVGVAVLAISNIYNKSEGYKLDNDKRESMN